MSALIFNISPAHAVVAMDTLATKPDGSPLFFTSKAYHLPHLRTIIAGTGYGDLICDLHREVNTRMLLAGIENLSEHTPAALHQLWIERRKKYPDDQTTTVYLFGLSERTGEVVAFAFRSTNNFAAERLPSEGSGYKPLESAAGIEFSLEAIPEIMEKMRVEQAKESDLSKRIHIGGEIVMFVLTADGFASRIIHRFSDADGHEAQMREQV